MHIKYPSLSLTVVNTRKLHVALTARAEVLRLE